MTGFLEHVMLDFSHSTGSSAAPCDPIRQLNSWKIVNDVHIIDDHGAYLNKYCRHSVYSSHVYIYDTHQPPASQRSSRSIVIQAPFHSATSSSSELLFTTSLHVQVRSFFPSSNSIKLQGPLHSISPPP